MKVANAFSISMLPVGAVTTVSFAGPRSATQVQEYLRNQSLESVIGHADTARLVGGQLGQELPVNRATVKLEVGEHLLVAQYVGPRLPEGATTLPEGARIDYFIVVPIAVE